MELVDFILVGWFVLSTIVIIYVIYKTYAHLLLINELKLNIFNKKLLVDTIIVDENIYSSNTLLFVKIYTKTKSEKYNPFNVFFNTIPVELFRQYQFDEYYNIFISVDGKSLLKILYKNYSNNPIIFYEIVLNMIKKTVGDDNIKKIYIQKKVGGDNYELKKYLLELK